MTIEIKGETYVSGDDAQSMFFITSPRMLDQWISEGMPVIKRGCETFIPIKRAQAWFRGEDTIG